MTKRLSQARLFRIARSVLLEAQAALQAGGSESAEVFVLLTGRWADDDIVDIAAAYVPDQLAKSHAKGLSVTVPGAELDRLNREWLVAGEFLAAQVHSHPTWPFHSSTDDGYAMVTQLGGLSIVVGLFGYVPMNDLASCAVYRLDEAGWRWLSPIDVASLIRIT